MITVELMVDRAGLNFTRARYKELLGTGKTVQQVLELEAHPSDVVRIIVWSGKLPDHVLRAFAVACVESVLWKVPEVGSVLFVQRALEAAKENASPERLRSARVAMSSVATDLRKNAVYYGDVVKARVYKAVIAMTRNVAFEAAWITSTEVAWVKVLLGSYMQERSVLEVRREVWTDILDLLRKEMEQ